MKGKIGQFSNKRNNLQNILTIISYLAMGVNYTKILTIKMFRKTDKSKECRQGERKKGKRMKKGYSKCRIAVLKFLKGCGMGRRFPKTAYFCAHEPTIMALGITPTRIYTPNKPKTSL
jgi:hypothetical protein